MQPDRRQPVFHPFRGFRPVVHAPDIAAGINRTGVFVFNPDFDRVGKKPRNFLYLKRFQASQTGRRQVAGNTAHAQAFRPVGRNRNFKYRINVHHIRRLPADRGIGRQRNNAVVIFADAQFLFRAQHAETLNTADFADRQFFVIAGNNDADRSKNADGALFDIRRTADNLQRFAAGIDLQQVQVVGIRMHFAFFHLGGDKTRKLCRRVNHFFHFQPDAGQGFGNFIHGRRRVQMFFQPG